MFDARVDFIDVRSTSYIEALIGRLKKGETKCDSC